MQQGAALVEGSVSGHLLRLTGPLIVGVLSIVLMNVADAIFVGQLGPDALAALSFTFPAVTLLGGVSLGLGTGVTSVLARAIGAGAQQRVRRVAADALLLALLLSGVLTVAGVASIEPVFSLLGAGPEVLPLVRDYMATWYAGLAFLFVPMTGNAALRATGDVRTPAAIMIGAALLNVVLDPLFIFGLGLGVQGAAIATVLSRSITLALSLGVLIFREDLVSLKRPTAAALAASWQSVLRVAAPAAATSAAGPLTMGVLTIMLASHGQHAVAAHGAGSRAAMLALVPMIALSAAAGPLAGQCWGASRPDRVGETLRLSDRAAAAWGLLVWAALAALRTPIAALFTDDAAVAEVLSAYLLIAPAGVALQGVAGVAGAVFNAIDQPMKAAALTLLRAPVLSVPLALLGSAALGPPGIFAGMATAEVLTGLAARAWTRRLRSATPPR